jgi:hypothetical protein
VEHLPNAVAVSQSATPAQQTKFVYTADDVASPLHWRRDRSSPVGGLVNKLLVLLALLLAPAANAAAQWQTEHTVLAATSSATIAADWLLSVDAVRRGSFDEMNPLLGSRPSVGRMNTYNILVLGGNLVIGRLLSGRLRTLWFTAVASFESAIVLHQRNIGLRIDFAEL